MSDNWNELEDDEMEEETYLNQEDKQILFERFLNVSFELKAELTNKFFGNDQTYLTEKEEEFVFALTKFHQNI